MPLLLFQYKQGTLSFPDADWTTYVCDKLIADDVAADDRFGSSIALDYNTSKVVIGARSSDQNGGLNDGKAYLFEESGGTFLQTNTFYPDGGVLDSRFGSSCAISGDGNTIAIGSYGESNNQGSVSVFTFNGSVWSLQQKILNIDSPTNGDYFGYTVALNQTGNTLIIGAYYKNATYSGEGVVYVHTRSGSVWSPSQTLYADPPEPNLGFGSSLDLSQDGNYLIVGGPYDQNQYGQAFIYKKIGSTFTFQQRIDSTETTSGDYFGYSCAINGDGTICVCGAYQEESAAGNGGSAYIFTRTGETWTEGQRLNASDAGNNYIFGITSDMNYKGTIIAIGSSGHDSNSGATYIFKKIGSSWIEQTITKESVPTSNDQLGSTLALSTDGTKVFSGIPNDTITGSPELIGGGSVLVCDSTKAYTPRLLIHSDDPNGSTNFVDSSTNNYTLLITGSPIHSTAQSKFGSSSVYFGGGASMQALSGSTPGTGDFTMDCWIRGDASSFNVRRDIFTIFNMQVAVYMAFGSRIYINYDGAAVSYVTNPLSNQTWYHLALVRSSGAVSLYVDGVRRINNVPFTTDLTSNIMRWGSGFNQKNKFLGHMDELRVTDTAVWTDSFTPPTAPY